MSNLSLFMKKNKKVRENVKFTATKSLADEKGKPLEWEIKPLTTKEDERIRDDCTVEVPIVGKPNMYRQKLNANKYVAKLLASSVVFPDLLDAELQDSYGVKTAEDLLKELIDDVGEFNDFSAFVQKLNGFDVSLEEKVDEAKN
ncbi:phage portal protein [Clostridia bacterium]|nr:phage portal protein [Clostridia bacterium]